ncbi:MAG: hypothetical protein IJF65_08755 [Clostridia bacterium]|nr:hypothetical protein [Clostridia bacterium]
MKIDLTCPVELWQFKLPTEDFPGCAFLLYNLSEKPVTSVQVTLVCLDEAGQVASRHVERVQGIDGQPQSTFEIAVPVTMEIPFCDLEMIIEKVWFDDATIWRRGNAPLTDYQPNLLPNNRRLEMLRYVAGPDAVGYPQDQGAVWVCVCGRANAAHEAECRRCCRDKEQIFELFNQVAIDQMILDRENELAAKAKKAREDASEKERLREEKLAKKRRRKRRIIAALITILLLGAAAYGIIFHGLPYYRYVRASEQLSSGLYEEARAAFEEMGDYRDAQTLILDCDYGMAADHLAQGTEESLLAAQEAFIALKDYKNSAELAQKACYERAHKRMAAKDYLTAAALFEEVSGYSDARLKISECHYSHALSLMDAKDYPSARKAFLALGDYSEASKMATECLYRPAVAAMEEGQWQTALDLLNQIPDYLDAATRLQTVHYQLAESYTAQEKHEEAGEHYIAAGDYLDASLKAGQSWYHQAKALMDKKEYGKAAEMFQQIADYEDSQTLGFECIYQIAMGYMSKKDYSRAYDLLVTIPAHMDASVQARECLYLPAVDAIQKGQYDEALTYLEKLPADYRDTAEQIKEVNYRKASKLLTAKDYQAAYEAFTALTPYSDSSRKAQEALYAMAQEALTAKAYQTAVGYLETLGSYEDSDKLLKNANYQLALSYLNEGQTQEALALFDALGKYEDAQDQAGAIRYAAALAVKEEGDYAQAAQLFAHISGYKDAAVQRQACLYAIAVQARDEGKDMAQAGRLFEQVGKYEDAPQQAEACYDAHYASVYATASTAMEENDYQTVIEALETFDLSDPPKKYADMPSMYEKANYAYANELYEAGKRYEALVYYRKIPDYKDVTSKKLQRNCYLILGKWVSSSGVEMEFRDNGTCNLGGEELYFTVSGTYSMLTGTDPDHLESTHRVSRIDKKSLTLRDTRYGRTVTYKMTRVEDPQ